VLLRNPITGIAVCCARRQRPCRRAADESDELAAFQLIELHLVHHQPDPELQDIELARTARAVDPTAALPFEHDLGMLRGCFPNASLAVLSGSNARLKH
jgi:hypothetical protein